MQEFSPQTDLALRFRNYVILLDRLVREVEEELQHNQSVRNEWSEWHSNWKRAWLSPGTGSQTSPLKERFSVKRRLG
ncbi:hypothetical protein EHQ53_09865 [Leptospira langatensis]|uniref:Uncharacterized protein n=1 Tax=Leptospira langatensis TaxID=2484983 RepID=A0A5F1ZTC3_9LEPT|nr:hypothetical protein [Leptospira langatensis]TGK00258.1 hypothetical protein EHO57_13325 [Leptospira langatensis]TGL41107.1 hypothetical protein EHQ53_09865 [Leptospira langatensis]